MGLQARHGDGVYITGHGFRKHWEENEVFVCSIDVAAGDGGTGVLVGPDLVLTNHHVIKRALVSESAIDAEKVEIWFDHKKVDGAVQPGREVRLAGDGLVAWRPASQSDRDDGDGLPADDELDYALLRRVCFSL